jgi:hypothetical protein
MLVGMGLCCSASAAANFQSCLASLSLAQDSYSGKMPPEVAGKLLDSFGGRMDLQSR